MLLDSTKLLDRPDAQQIKRKMGKLPDALRTLDLERVEQDFKQFELLQNTLTVEQQEQSPDFNELAARCETHRALIAQGRAAFLDIQLNEGRRWDLKSFTKREGYAGDSKYSQQMFKKLIDLEVQPIEERCRSAVLKIRIWSISGWSYLNHLINSARTLRTL